jgi:toxin ParE1/3/4
MKSLVFSPAAADDIDAIWDYTAATWGVAQAEHYTDDIRDVCLGLAAGTKSGRPADVRSGYSRQPVGSHVIYFRDAGQTIQIIRILHQRQDAGRHL